MRKEVKMLKKYITENKINEAIVVGTNLLNKVPGNKEVFNTYFNFLCDLAKKSPEISIDTRKRYVQRADVALALFSENVELTDDIMELILEYRKKLSEIADSINSEIDNDKEKFRMEREKDNNEAVELLKKLIDKLSNTSNKSEFDKILGQIGDIDNIIDKDFLTKKQSNEYDKLTVHCTDVVNKKLKDFERRENEVYNLRAVDAYEKVYNWFKNNDSPGNHNEVLRNFFAYDASRLLNETLVYYNHVYSYVLSKLDDNGKLLVTKLAIQSEKKVR
jgi:hypothetical protein